VHQKNKKNKQKKMMTNANWLSFSLGAKKQNKKTMTSTNLSSSSLSAQKQNNQDND